MAAAVMFSAAYTFIKFSPLTYGFEVPASICNSLKWMGTWDFMCAVQ